MPSFKKRSQWTFGSISAAEHTSWVVTVSHFSFTHWKISAARFLEANVSAFHVSRPIITGVQLIKSSVTNDSHSRLSCAELYTSPHFHWPAINDQTSMHRTGYWQVYLWTGRHDNSRRAGCGQRDRVMSSWRERPQTSCCTERRHSKHESCHSISINQSTVSAQQNWKKYN